ncbi:glycoside hydrolase family 32 protein [Streptomyces sp.]|uniref:glycoside hydrolase family 32 protein n=1 Tax=Streptomyces sp. TaxID=1931 RepID=UPI002F4004F8
MPSRAPEPAPPLFHIAATPAEWLNDPNGPVHFGGSYHLFCQPDWKHAVSDDLVRWTRLPDAFAPTPGGPDRGGCWSGGSVVDGERVYALYTGVDEGAAHQVVCAAYSDGDLTKWTKVPQPLITTAPDGLDLVGFRDPWVMRHGDEWLMVIGAGEKETAHALLYRSADLLQWDYAGPLFSRAAGDTDPVWTGEMWECPQFFPIGGVWALGVSVWYEDVPYHSAYLLGDFDGRRLTITSAGRLDHGPDFYAPTSMTAPDGRQIMWGWAWENFEAGASHYNIGGYLTVAREVYLSDGELLARPVAELASLRGDALVSVKDVPLSEVPACLAANAGPAFDAEFVLGVPDGATAYLDLLAAADGSEFTRVLVDRAQGTGGLDTTRTTLHTSPARGLHTAPIPFGDRVHVRVLLDATVLEVFIDGRPFTARVYPSDPASRAILAGAVGAGARIAQAEGWRVTTSAVTDLRGAPAVQGAESR